MKPGAQVTREVPRSNRGVSAQYSIKNIISKSMGLAHAGL
jgi:hypothetical protein